MKELNTKTAYNFHKIDNCNGCLLCIVKCPSKAISVREKEEVINIDRFKCISCKLCKEVCPIEAIKFIENTNNNNRHINYRIKINRNRIKQFLG